MLREQLGSTDKSDFYVFNLRNRSSFRLTLNRLAANADVELVQDRDRDGEIDPGELIASSRASQQRPDAIHLEGLDRGIYHLRVFLKGSGQTFYNLSLSAAPTMKVSPTYEVVKLTNAYRIKNGQLPLAVNTQLANAAQSYSRVMALGDHWSHTSPDGTQFYERVLAADYSYSQVAENLSRGRTNPLEALNGWIASPGHRRNLLAYQVQEIGVGYFFLQNDGGFYRSNHYWAQSLATPGDKRVVPTVPEKPGGR